MSILLNDVVSGISNALYFEFGEEYKIYKEAIEQGLCEPCFSIVCISAKSIKGLWNRSTRNYIFCIHYFAKNKQYRTECMEVWERLIDCLEYIEVGGDLVRGTQIRTEEVTEDGIMHVMVEYSIPVIKIEEQEKMEHYHVKSEVKENG